MATYRTNKETQASIENIISEAEKQLILVSPYIKLTNTWLSRIKDRAEKGVKIKIIYRTGELKDDGILNLATHENVELKHTDNLHAKCYFNEKEMIITSFNLLESSEKNWEMGILINIDADKVMYEKAKRDVDIIFNDSNQHANLPASSNTSDIKGQRIFADAIIEEGFCIRCGVNIPFNIHFPMCEGCFGEWNAYANRKYEEEYCHYSGEESDGETCFDRPILNEYWKEAKRKYGL